MGRWSEEECLLETAKNRSNIDPNDQGDLPGSLSDKDVPQKRTREKETPKNISGKATATALNALQLLFWLHLCGEDS